ncbi:hypothetical protein CEXT_729591 [Caerostris extrusa]|uniref:Uncharacterized protein n=1 Tax=Caerostris extrusa TaxID=172846 RepID=A0AAV4NBA1_CAEEX|nr:hypothetical protein CEXT_729591 [Caerostris extrusa]
MMSHQVAEAEGRQKSQAQSLEFASSGIEEGLTNDVWINRVCITGTWKIHSHLMSSFKPFSHVGETEKWIEKVFLVTKSHACTGMVVVCRNSHSTVPDKSRPDHCLPIEGSSKNFL